MHGTIDSLFRVEWRPLADLDAIATEWRDLAGRALEPNVFYEPSFALAAGPVFGRDSGAGLVWSRAALASEASSQRGNSKVRAPDTRPEPGSSARVATERAHARQRPILGSRRLSQCILESRQC